MSGFIAPPPPSSLVSGPITTVQANGNDAFFHGRVYAGTDASGIQSASGMMAGTGAPGAGAGNNGDIYFRSDGGAGTTLYQRRAGAWVGIV